MSPVIVVIDDEPIDQNALCGLLVDAGYVVYGAGTVAEGLAMISRYRPSLVITDWSMPGAGGEDLLRDMRADPSLRETPALIYTAFCADAVPWEKGRLYRCSGVIVKPIMDSAKVLIKIAEIIGPAEVGDG